MGGGILLNNSRLENCDVDIRVMLTLLWRNYWAVRMGGGWNWLHAQWEALRLAILKFSFCFLLKEAEIKTFFLIILSLLPFLTLKTDAAHRLLSLIWLLVHFFFRNRCDHCMCMHTYLHGWLSLVHLFACAVLLENGRNGYMKLCFKL